MDLITLNRILNNIGMVYKPITVGEPFGYANYHLVWKYESLVNYNGLYVLLMNFSR